MVGQMWSTKVRVVLLAAACVMAALPLAGQDKPPVTVAPADSRPADSFQDRYPRYHIQAGDSFDLKFEFSPEFDQTVTVQPDGFVSLRGVGDVHVADYTQPQLKEALAKAYGKILYEPVIEVILKDFEKPYFVADGQVTRPGKYDLRGSTTLTQALAAAGGMSSGAKSSQVLLFRKLADRPGWTEATLVDVKKMQDTHNLAEDPILRPGDMIWVPKSFIGKIDRFLPTTSIGTFLRPF